MFIFNVKVNGNKLGKALLAILIIIILIVTGIVCYNLFTKSRFKTNDVYIKMLYMNFLLKTMQMYFKQFITIQMTMLDKKSNFLVIYTEYLTLQKNNLFLQET